MTNSQKPTSVIVHSSQTSEHLIHPVTQLKIASESCSSQEICCQINQLYSYQCKQSNFHRLRGWTKTFLQYKVVWMICLKLKISGKNSSDFYLSSANLYKFVVVVLGYLLTFSNLPLEARGDVTSILNNSFLFPQMFSRKCQTQDSG